MMVIDGGDYGDGNLNFFVMHIRTITGWLVLISAQRL